jgi:hypothetical protein
MKKENALYNKIAVTIEQPRKNVATAVNLTMAFWLN